MLLSGVFSFLEKEVQVSMDIVSGSFWTCRRIRLWAFYRGETTNKRKREKRKEHECVYTVYVGELVNRLVKHSSQRLWCICCLESVGDDPPASDKRNFRDFCFQKGKNNKLFNGGKEFSPAARSFSLPRPNK
jgi:hypothetical protein